MTIFTKTQRAIYQLIAAKFDWKPEGKRPDPLAGIHQGVSMKTSDAFTLAESALHNGTSEGNSYLQHYRICSAMSAAAFLMRIPYGQLAKAMAVIVERLEPHGSYTKWAEAQGLLPADWESDKPR